MVDGKVVVVVGEVADVVDEEAIVVEGATVVVVDGAVVVVVDGAVVVVVGRAVVVGEVGFGLPPPLTACTSAMRSPTTYG